jgi:hypothetical protein
MGKKGKTTRLPMTRRVMAIIRYHKRLKATPRRKRKENHRACCGITRNLKSGRSGGKLRWLCPACAYEAEHPGM